MNPRWRAFFIALFLVLLAGLLLLDADTPYWQLAFWQLVIGAGSGAS